MHIEPALEAEPHPVQEERRYVPDVRTTREQRARFFSEEEWAIMEWQERMSDGAGISPPPLAAAAGFGGNVPPWWFPGGFPWGPQGPVQLGGGVTLEAGTDASGILIRPPPWWAPNPWWSSLPWWKKRPVNPFSGYAKKKERLKRVMARLLALIKHEEYLLEPPRRWDPPIGLLFPTLPPLLPGQPRPLPPPESDINADARRIRDFAEAIFEKAAAVYWGPNEPEEGEIKEIEEQTDYWVKQDKELGT